MTALNQFKRAKFTEMSVRSLLRSKTGENPHHSHSQKRGDSWIIFGILCFLVFADRFDTTSAGLLSLSKLDTLNGILSLLAGTGVAATAISGHPVVAFYAGATVAISNVINVMIGSSRKAALHRELRGRFIGLERQMVLSDQTPESCQKFTDERLRIESEEPPVIGALEALCYNEEARAEGNSKYVCQISWWQRLGAQFLDYTDRPDPHHP